MTDSQSRKEPAAIGPDGDPRASKTFLERILEKLCALLMGGIVVLLALQIFVRYAAGGSMPWTAEMATWLFTWCTFMGAVLVYLEKKHIVIDFLVSFLPPKPLAVLQRIQTFIALILLGFLLVTGVQITILYANQTATSIELSKAFLFVSLPISCALMIGITLYNWIKGR